MLQRLLPYVTIAAIVTVLIALTAFLHRSSRELERSATEVDRAVRVAAAYQDLRFYAAQAEGAYLRYQTGDRTPEDQQRLADAISGAFAAGLAIQFQGTPEDRAANLQLDKDFGPFIEYAYADTRFAETSQVIADLSARTSAMANRRTQDARNAVARHQSRAEFNRRLETTLLPLGLVFAAALTLIIRRLGRRETDLITRALRTEQETLKHSERRLSALVSNAADMVLVTDRLGRISYAGPSTEHVMGIRPADVVGRNLIEFVAESDRRRARAGLAVSAASPPGTSGRLTTTLIRADETRAVTEVRSTNLLHDPDVNGLVINISDVTERVNSDRLRDRLQTAVESTSDIVILADDEGRILHLNRAAKATLGVDDNHPAVTVGDLVPNWEESIDPAVASARANGSWKGELVLDSVDDGFAVEAEIVVHRERRGAVSFISCVARDISERRSFEARLVHLANHDSLTGLLNRRRFEEEVTRELVRLANTPESTSSGAVFFLDLDNFKAVNDGLGHRVGDDLLREVAFTIQRALPEHAVLARLGGDEFGILLPGATQGEADITAEALVNAVRRRAIILAGQSVSATCSVGFTLLGRGGTDTDTVLANADLAMYVAKRERDSWHRYSAESAEAMDHQDLKERRVWDQRLRSALIDGAFEIYAQPVARIGDSVASFELLIRLPLADGTLALPATFLPVAERSGLITEVDRWMLTKAVGMIAAEAAEGRRLTLAVNLSGRTVADETLPSFLASLVSDRGIDPSLLIVELTETAAIADLDQARAFIEQLRRLGVQFAIDDFGAGFASFSYLRHLPVDRVKIDGSFVRHIAHDSHDRHVVKALVDVAHSLEKDVVAEFVESEETLRILEAMGVDFAQGYYIGRPAPATLLRGTEATPESRAA